MTFVRFKNYNSFYIDDICTELLEYPCPYRRALAAKLTSMAEAIKAVEYIRNGNDMDEAVLINYIKDALGEDAESLALAAAVEEANAAQEALQKQILIASQSIAS